MTDTPLALGRFLLGSGLLLVAVVASAVLTLQQISKANIPGCGPGSACGELASGVWGKVPIVDWPVSFLGLAYFGALLVAWMAVRGNIGPAMRWMIRLGAIGSLIFTGVMVFKWTICPYCMVVHIANLAFVAMIEVTGRRPALAAGAAAHTAHAGAWQGRERWQGLSAAAIVFFAGTLAIAVVDQQAARSAGEQQEAQLADSMKQLLRAQDDQDDPTLLEPDTQTVAQTPAREPEPDPAPLTRPTPPAPTPVATTEPQPAPPRTAPTEATPNPRNAAVTGTSAFSGRYRWGPERASIRIVMFTGYQCPDCRNMDTQIKEVLRRWPDLVSFSIKHFPLSNLCNPHMPQGPQGNPHGNACWAARASEAAGMIAGFDGFSRMHDWLYQNSGAFTDASLPVSLRELGFDPASFIPVMASQETLRRVQADIEEGMQYGLSQTPMIFINGTELKGWRAPNALTRAVEAMAANPPPARTANRDHPMGAVEKAITDWREEPNQSWPSRNRAWGLGPQDAPVRIQLFGDLLDANTARAHKAVRQAMQGRDDIRYEFRYFPFDQSCNPTLPRTGVPQGCRAARAAEAAGQLGGDQAFWKMHEWLINNQGRFSDETLSAAAAEMGIMADPLLAFMQAPQVEDAIQQDVGIANRLGAPRMPRLHINGRLVPRWEVPDENVLEQIISYAAAEG